MVLRRSVRYGLWYRPVRSKPTASAMKIGCTRAGLVSQRPVRWLPTQVRPWMEPITLNAVRILRIDAGSPLRNFQRAPLAAAYCFRLSAVSTSGLVVIVSMCTSSPRRSPRISCTFTMLSMRSEEHTSELQSLMRISYAVFYLKKKTQTITENDKKRLKKITTPLHTCRQYKLSKHTTNDKRILHMKLSDRITSKINNQ